MRWNLKGEESKTAVAHIQSSRRFKLEFPGCRGSCLSLSLFYFSLLLCCRKRCHAVPFTGEREAAYHKNACRNRWYHQRFLCHKQELNCTQIDQTRASHSTDICGVLFSKSSCSLLLIFHLISAAMWSKSTVVIIHKIMSCPRPSHTKWRNLDHLESLMPIIYCAKWNVWRKHLGMYHRI